MFPIPLTKPLAFLDIESTGVNAWQDRIIDLAIVKINPNQKREEASFRVNPGMLIPPESTQVHHITDADVKDAPLFAVAAPAIDTFLKDCDLAGYNLIRFDIPILVEEFIRARVPFTMDGRRVLDAQRIFHKREPRTLEAAVRFYCGEFLLDAHSAMADTRATLQVVEGQFHRYGDLPKDMDALHLYCNPKDPKAVDASGKLAWVGDQIVINFGKRKGQSLKEIITHEKSFVNWLLNADFPRDVKQIVENASRGIYPAPPPPAPVGVPPDDVDGVR